MPRNVGPGPGGGIVTLTDGQLVKLGSVSEYSGSDATVTLPSLTGSGKRTTVINDRASTGKLTVAAAEGEAIDGASALELLPGTSATVTDAEPASATTTLGKDSWSLLDWTGWAVTDSSGIMVGTPTTDANGWTTVEVDAAAAANVRFVGTEVTGDLLRMGPTDDRPILEMLVEVVGDLPSRLGVVAGVVRHAFGELCGCGASNNAGTWRLLGNGTYEGYNGGGTGNCADSLMIVRGIIHAPNYLPSYTGVSDLHLSINGTRYDASLNMTAQMRFIAAMSYLGGNSTATYPTYPEVRVRALAATTGTITFRIWRRWLPAVGRPVELP